MIGHDAAPSDPACAPNDAHFRTHTWAIPEILIRDAHSDDYAAMARIFRRASLANPGDREALLAHPDALQLSDDLIRSGRARVAALADTTIVGFASTHPRGIGMLGAAAPIDVVYMAGWAT